MYRSTGGLGRQGKGLISKPSEEPLSDPSVWSTDLFVSTTSPGPLRSDVWRFPKVHRNPGTTSDPTISHSTGVDLGRSYPLTVRFPVSVPRGPPSLGSPTTSWTVSPPRVIYVYSFILLLPLFNLVTTFLRLLYSRTSVERGRPRRPCPPQSGVPSSPRGRGEDEIGEGMRIRSGPVRVGTYIGCGPGWSCDIPFDLDRRWNVHFSQSTHPGFMSCWWLRY